MDYYKRALELNDETVKTDVTSTRMQKRDFICQWPVHM